MKKFHLGLMMSTALLAGCAGFTGQGYVDDLNAAEVTGSTFTEALAMEYRDLSNFEWSEMMDYRDGQHYAQKGLAALSGEAVLVDDVASRDLPDFAVADITAAHTRLTDALNAGAREHAPTIAAKAQAKLDCWMEQQEENHQPDDIAACRKEFEDAIAQLGGGVQKYVVFFDFGSSRLTAAGKQIVHQSVVDAKAQGVSQFDVIGHTDTVGSARSNLNLSTARANAVRAALLHEGVRGRDIRVSGSGESKLMVPTADGVKEASNRRAEIAFK